MTHHFHLPDIPEVGHSTRREKELTDSIMLFMRHVERDRARLLTIVLDGRDRWKKVAGDIWRGYRIGKDASTLDAIYDYFALQAAPVPVQVELLDHLQNPLKRDELHTAMMPQLEIERESLRLMAKWTP